MTNPPSITENTDEGMTEAEFEKFYTAAQVQGQRDMETLLQKGLYSEKLPKPLRSQKAADAFQNAFELIGGVPRLALWADKNPSAFFALYSKLIPSTVQAQVQANITVHAPWMSPNRLAYMDGQQQEVIDVTPTPPTDSSKD
jgi:hypothetical protein